MSSLVRLEPVGAKATVGNEGDRHLEGVLHLFDDDMLNAFFLFREDGEVEFVVYLENHLATDALSLKALEDMNHGDLDNGGSGSLNGGIDGVALSKTTNGSVGRVDIRQVATTSE